MLVLFRVFPIFKQSFLEIFPEYSLGVLKEILLSSMEHWRLTTPVDCPKILETGFGKPSDGIIFS